MVMTLRLPLRRESNGSIITLGKEIHTGGEGTVYRVNELPALLAKIYHAPTALRAQKLRVMIANPPYDPMQVKKYVSLAWPVDRVLDGQGTCIGFLMPYISKTTPLLTLYNSKDRRQTAPSFTWQYLLRTAKNLASTVEALHASGYVVGDLNESNILVSTSAIVTLIDCDSMQVPGAGGRMFRCTVGKEEYTPPELQGCIFKELDRIPGHDNFGLAVLVFLLLMR